MMVELDTEFKSLYFIHRLPADDDQSRMFSELKQDYLVL